MDESGQEFTVKQANAILQRALELKALQSSLRLKQENGNGVTLNQIFRSASELGIESDLVDKAVRDVRSGQPASSKVRRQDSLPIEREFPIQISEVDFPALLEHLRTFTNYLGNGQVIGGTLEWSTFNMGNREMLHVVVIPSLDSTKVRIRSTNPFSQFPFQSKSFFVLPLIIVFMGFIPLFTFGSKYFSWTFMVPFVTIAAFALLIPKLAFGRFSRSRDAEGTGDKLMESIGNWLRSRSIGS